MSTIKDIILNESVADVLTALIPGSSYPRIDRMYVDYKFEVIKSGELQRTFEKLFADGVFATDNNGHPIKGPKWVAPGFVTSKKYGPAS
ncbi:hypothetical protein D3C76_1025680 [compost metagenome]|jgi:hypothetical protein|uniref:Immunity protein n=1 Tax=Pseudomonas wadenswilerensis TaxID=1785161 RepID=A0A380T4Q7_9PSED|nr:immunity protein [Pseudomonas]MCE5982506.1 immunity protein [Pseudomonas sp. LF19]UVM23465.1 immunity protein [Pseudomonas wadenswilerensis]SPO67766.1 conserved protein of unknown function [Pseudomonas sp. JV241A]SUQ64476.1 hypothetical protein CCOS864_03937 [Pseudomonas wadenswilerensis]